MAVTESDLELVEAYLDGEPAEGLVGRLSTDAELATAVADAEAARAGRSKVWAALEPTDPEADEFYWGVRRAMLHLDEPKPRSMWSVWRTAGFSSAAAACVLVGFWAGRLGHPISVPSPAVNPTLVASQQRHVMVPITDENGNFTGWQPVKSTEEAREFQQDLRNTLPTPNRGNGGKVDLASHEIRF